MVLSVRWPVDEPDKRRQRVLQWDSCSASSCSFGSGGGESDCCGGSHMTEHSVAEYGDGCDRRRRGEVGEEGE